MRRKPTIPRACERCGTEFQALSWRVRKGLARFCSRHCAGLFLGTATKKWATAAERFWQQVNKHGPLQAHCPELGSCWVWTGPRARNGYATIRYLGRTRSVHVVAYVLTNGEPPIETSWILHHCDGGADGCVRPSHLYAGTALDNNRDRDSRGRTVKGSGHSNAKLTEMAVLEIRALASAGASQVAIAQQFGVDKTNISMIVRRKTWTHI